MISDDGTWVLCSEPGCPNKFKNHRWGNIKSEDWFKQKDGNNWCPEHIPEWVAAWRAKRKVIDNDA